MATCPEPRCQGGLLYYGVGAPHEQQTTSCPTCGGTGTVPDGAGGPTPAGSGCLATVIGWVVMGVIALVLFFIIGIALLIFDPRSPL
jgi:hypothetical protein